MRGLGQITTYEVVYLENASSLRDYLNISLSASLNLGPFKASAKADYVRTHTENANSAYLVVNVRVLNALEQLTAYELTSDALRLIDRPASFINTYGDEFVTAIQTGGEFVGIVELQFKTVSDHSNFSAKLSASYMGFNFSGSFVRDIKAEELNFSFKSSIMKTGGRGGITFIEAPTTPATSTPAPAAGTLVKTKLATELGNALEKVLLEAQKFPAEVAQYPVVYSVITSDYNIASNLPLGGRAPTLNYARRALQNAVTMRDILRAARQSKVTNAADGDALDQLVLQNSPIELEIVKWLSHPWSLEQNERALYPVDSPPAVRQANLPAGASPSPTPIPSPGPFEQIFRENGNKSLFDEYKTDYLKGIGDAKPPSPGATATPTPKR